MSMAVISAPADLPAIHERMTAVAEVAHLPLRGEMISGSVGGLLGQGTGSSLDFQDHRLYFPGDDPRHINWQAYARTGHYTMKLYREEISPRVDIVLDASRSMFFEEVKARRAWELLYFAMQSALRLGASLRCHALSEGMPSEVPLEQLLGHGWVPAAEPAPPRPPAWERVPFRAASLRVVISDLLFEAEPLHLVSALASSKGRAIILAPFCLAEAAPDWRGNLDFEDCESGRRDKRRVDDGVRERYMQSYRHHFDAWREACARRSIVLARVPAEGDFLDALRSEAVGAGAVEL